MFQETMRQWTYPKELRIAAPCDSYSVLLNALRRALSAARPPTADDTRRSRSKSGELDATALAQIATHLWRLRNKMADIGSGRPREEFRRAYRHLEAAWDVLTEAGLDIVDPAGRPFDHGQSLRALAFQPVAGLKRRMIMETINPTILLCGKVIQAGEVIVGIPEDCLSDEDQQGAHGKNDDRLRN